MKKYIISDTDRLNWLEEMANEPEGILLHNGQKSTGRLGLGLGNRNLREAIDLAIGNYKGYKEKVKP